MLKKIDNLLSRTGDIALRRRAKWILKQITEENPKRILDLGCGDGFYLHLITEIMPGTEIVGIDQDQNALRSARRNIKRKRVRLLNESLPALGFKSNSFNLILLSEVLEHVRDDLAALREVHRLLKANGLIIISVPNSKYPLFWDPVSWILQRIWNFHIKSGFWAGIWNQHERLYAKEQLLRLLKRSGFGDIRVESLTRYCLPFNHYLLNIMARILVKDRSSTLGLVSKFNKGIDDKEGFSLFSPVFFLDRLNDRPSDTETGVSLVAMAKKHR